MASFFDPSLTFSSKHMTMDQAINQTYSPEAFLHEAKPIFLGNRRITKRRGLVSQLDMYHAFFGTWPCITADLWHRVDPFNNIHPKSKMKHLLWALLFLTCYSTETINASTVGVHEDTFRDWMWPWIDAIAALSMDLIKFSNRFCGNWHYWTFCVDGIDCPIQEPRHPFWSGWKSHKFKGAGLRYEIASAVTTGHIIWINGPFPAGAWTDPMIFKQKLASLVMVGTEKGVCDAGYHFCHEWLFLPFWRKKKNIGKLPRNELHEYIRARHETLNGRLHRFNVISTIFRHAREKHHSCFHACAVIVQLEMMHGIEYRFSVVPSSIIENQEYDYYEVDPETYYPI